MYDYLRRLRNADMESANVISSSIDTLMDNNSGNTKFSLYEAAPPSHELPILQIASGMKTPISLHNPLAWNLEQFYQLRINTTNVILKYSNGTQIQTQIIQDSDTNNYLLSFIIPMNALEIKMIYLESSTTKLKLINKKLYTKEDYNSNELISMDNNYFQILISMQNGSITNIFNKYSNKNQTINQQFIEYISPDSSAYSMKPNSSFPLSPDHSFFEISYFSDSIYSQVDVYYNSYIKFTIRLINSNQIDLGQKIDFSVLIGPVIKDTEVSVRFNTNWNTNGTWYSDNGLALDEHELVHLPYMDPQGIASNFHSLKNTALISNTDQNLDFVVITAQSAGVTSLNDGELEIMMHRRCGSWDDKTTVHLFYQLLFDDSNYLKNNFLGKSTQILQYPPILFTGSGSYISSTTSLKDTYQPLSVPFPDEIHLFSLAAAKNFLALNQLSNENNTCEPTTTLAYRLQNISPLNASAFAFSFNNCNTCASEERGLTFLPLKNTTITSQNLQPMALQSWVISLECN